METSSMLDHSETGEDSNITIYHELHESTIALINNNFNMTPATLHHATRDVLYYTHQQLQLLEMCIPFFKDNKSRTLTVGCLVTFAMAQFDCFNKVTNACAHALTRTLQDGSKDETLENLAIATTISAASARHLQNDLLAIIGEIAKLNYQSQYGNQSSSSNPNAGTSSNAGQQ
ncbi:hypothetical protein GGI15_001702 [Coemansia interrupta]|uniref:Uncharacterized protein n=1 Tax=Coemansia interrupta TaxID=1126814 RepID=A0A9W8HJ52_9FUNG|nr:hypothetical protein GGI15_001702 [Coemansia interrupta]